VNVAEPDSPVPDVFIVKVPLLGLGTAAQEESPRRNVDALGEPVAAKRATGAVPLARFEAFKDVTAAPEPLKVAVIVPAAKLPEASRATILFAPLEFVAVVALLDTLPAVEIVAKNVSVIALAFHTPAVSVPT
jgi:hypothetical protein